MDLFNGLALITGSLLKYLLPTAISCHNEPAAIHLSPLTESHYRAIANSHNRTVECLAPTLLPSPSHSTLNPFPIRQNNVSIDELKVVESNITSSFS